MLERLRWVIGRLAVLIEMVQLRLASGRSLGASVETEAEDPADWRFLRRAAFIGFLALASIAVGCSVDSSPFKEELAGSWFFGEPAPGSGASTAFLLFGLVAFYGGLVLLMRVWYGMTKTLTRRPGVPMKHLWWLLALWLVPMLVVAPILSKDVFCYAAQGEMMSHHINPYRYGPFTLGAGPYVNPVDPLWGNAPAPYGPLFLIIDGFFASASLHQVLGTVILLRLLAVVGVVLVGYCVPKICRVYDRDPGPVFLLTVLNPLVLLTLVGSAHNDAIMVGLLFAGITAAKTKHPVWGVVLCALAMAIKAPAGLGILYIGWDWLGAGVPWRQRIRPIVTAGIIAFAVLALITVVSGLGFGWIANLETPGTVRSWLAPTTALGLGLSGLAHGLGIGLSTSLVLSAARLLGFAVAAAGGVYLLFHSDRFGSLKALSYTLLLLVVLGPVVQPWYLTWGLTLLGPVAAARSRTLIIGASVLSPFIGLPGGRTLLSQMVHADPLSVALALVVLLGVLFVPLGRWSTSWRWRAGPQDLWGDVAHGPDVEAVPSIG